MIVIMVYYSNILNHSTYVDLIDYFVPWLGLATILRVTGPNLSSSGSFLRDWGGEVGLSRGTNLRPFGELPGVDAVPCTSLTPVPGIVVTTGVSAEDRSTRGVTFGC